MANILELFKNIRVSYVIDILIVAFIFYKIFTLIKDTRAEQLIKGIVLLLLLTKLAEVGKLYTINWLLRNIMNSGLLILFIIFQPELRRGLEYLGRSNKMFINWSDINVADEEATVNEICDAAASLSRQKIGALIVIERETGLNEIVATGTKIEGNVSSDLLINIFIPNTPLHDGAVIISNDKIKAAACFLPLTEDNSLSRELGTRHRAAVGMSEASDALVLVVSEETGSISIAQGGNLSRHLDINTLRERLMEVYKPKNEGLGFMQKWGIKNEDSEKTEEQ